MSRFSGASLAVACVFAAACVTTPEAPPPAEPEEVPAEREPEPTPRPDRVLRIGVVVSTSGSETLQQYGELVMDGIRVGADAASSSDTHVELVIRDDGGTAAGAARAVQALEEAGVRVIVGPLTEEAFTAAARARTSDRVTLISPMATREPETLANTFALNAVDTRGAAALGNWARRYSRVGVLHSNRPDAARQAAAFTAAYGNAGTLRQVTFPANSTNLGTKLAQLRDARVEAIYFPGSERELQVVLPQVDYLGLSDVQMLGNEAWVSDAARGLPQRLVEGAVIATPLWRESDELAWRDFVEQYESRYRRSLVNPVPALGYDAVRLAIRAAGEGSAGVTDFRGATGLLSLTDDAVTRRPFLVRIEAGRLVPVN